jgi:hypothetical protein
VHEFYVGLAGDCGPVDVGEGLGALGTSPDFLGEEGQSLRVLLLVASVLLAVLLQGGVLDQRI